MKKQLSLFSLAALLCASVGTALAQTPAVSGSASVGTGWSRNDIFQNKVFIENKGQFDGKNSLTSHRIKYGINSGGQEIYFTTHGLTWRYTKSVLPEEVLREIEEEKNGKKEEVPGELEREIAEKTKTTVYLVSMEWLGANPDAELMATNLVPEYYTYGDEKVFYKAAAYKKLTYKNLYPNIDVEYVFHEKEGIKYSLILHPGADASKIKMKYSGADNVYADKAGNVHLVTPLGDIIDHAPFTFYEKGRSVIPSDFEVNDNTISFKLSVSKSIKSTIIIDPWTVPIIMQTSNKALEMERDASGNIYILGGTNGTTGVPLLLQKYSAAGVFQWQYTPTLAWGRFTGEYGNDLKIDKANDVYIEAGAFGSEMFKLNSAGGVIWSIALQISEPYRMTINCDNSSFFVTGGIPDQQSAYFYNPGTGLLINQISNIFNYNINNGDLRDWVVAPNGNYYGLTVGQANEIPKLFAISPGMSELWEIPHTYGLAYWSAAYSGHYAGQPVSLHLIAVTRNFIYTTNGTILNKRNLATGAVIGAAVTIPGGVLATNANGNSGIIVDTCENVYVASQNAVYKYDSNLNPVTSAATAAAVYDICLGTSPGEILACGNGFLASLNLSACIPSTLNVTAVATPTGNCSNGNIGTATATTTGGTAAYSYYWIPGGQTSSSITGLGAGTYSVIVTDANCNKDTAVVTVTSSGALAASITKTNLLCNGATNGTATVTAISGASPYTYLWSTGSTTAAISGLSANTYTVTVTDINGCKVILPVNISQPPPLPVGITTKGTTCTTIMGAVTVSVGNSSAGPYTYLWSNGSTYNHAYPCQSEIQCGLNPGTYTVTITTAQGCTQTASGTVPPSTNPAIATFTQSPSGTVCIGTTVNFTHTGSVGTHNWVISPITPTNVSGTTTNFSYTFLTAGTYTVNHSTVNGGCSGQEKSTVLVIDCSSGPTVIASGSSVCPNICANVTSSGTGGTTPYTYSWSTGATTQNINPCPTTTTTYTVKVTDAGGKTATSTAVVTVNPAVTITATSTNITCSGTSTGSVTATPGSGTPAFNYVWSNGITTSSGSNLAAGNYTVTVIDSKGCTAVSTTTITAPTALIGQYTKGTASCSTCGCKEWVMVTGVNGTPPYNYQWPDGYDKRYKNALCPGVYNVIVTDGNGCKTTVKVNAP